MKLSATLLETFRLMRAGAIAESDLVRKIKGETFQTPEMELGRAFHHCLARPQKTITGIYEAEGFRFDPTAIETVLDHIDREGLAEVAAGRNLLVPGAGFVYLTAIADHIRGRAIAEFKTTRGVFEAARYRDSYQWRVMAMLFDAEVITYHVACLKEAGDRFVLEAISSLQLVPYPDLERDVRELLKEFCGYVKRRGLESYLIPKVEKAEAR
jgi:hypothetical protein